eukprot:CAMPEP_0113726508 /NCGR_PEP_ID=MMETSP0038_2-20120614/40491_1 /TAXON_ID=2898 /ORGANISM="Cryptomonas paramecium" /LENGTH=136 /DNA_ID=CAMNT_0000657163 /DNA_START=124 /DNA_END=531 /DNA_ORIENTATION=- /assembly_acc=CAM_ASM_000170
MADDMAITNTSVSEVITQATAQASEFTKFLVQRLNAQLAALSFSTNRISDTRTQYSVKSPICVGTRHSLLLGSFCAPYKAGNDSEFSVSVEMDQGDANPLTIFLVSDDNLDGEVEQFWGFDALNSSCDLLGSHARL